MPMKKSGLFRNKNAKATPYKDKGVTEVGKEAKTQSYKEYVQKMFGGGMTEPSMKRNKMMGGGMLGPHPQQGRPMNIAAPQGPSVQQPLRNMTIPYGKIANKGPGLKKGGKTKKMGMGGISSIPFGSGPTKLRNRNPDPILPRGKKGRGDI
jgi:hypothetical protein